MTRALRPPTESTVAESLEELIGDTPLLRLTYPDVPADTRLLAKLEMLNPWSSVKDRAARQMLRAAERSGALKPGGAVVESTSGNTGISLAALCASQGRRCVIVMPDNATEERRKILRAFGAEIVYSPAEGGLPACIELAERVQRETPGSFLIGQDKNPQNVQAHYETTGPEIWAATDGRVDVFVCAVGTGGTLTGVARYLKERTPVHVVAVEPAGSPVMSGGERGTHRIPGIGGGFVNDVTDMTCIDEIFTVTDEEAAIATRLLATGSGVLAGISSGAAVHAARRFAAQPRFAGATVVTVLPDTGERYLSIWETLATAPEETR